MPLRWLSFLIIELNYPFQASYRVSAPVSIGRSFNNWAFNSASRVYPFALAICSKSICCCRLICTCPRQHLRYICSRPCKSLHVNIMATKFWSTSLTSFVDIDNTQQLTLMDVSDWSLVQILFWNESLLIPSTDMQDDKFINVFCTCHLEHNTFGSAN